MHKTAIDTPETLELKGETYAVNDHVYVSSPWNASDGAPWVIGRIMEFIRESGTSGSSKKKKTQPIIQFKLAHYHRQRDLNSRHILDCRLLEASMASEVFCVTRLRGKCRVEFKNDRNPDEVEGWKTAPDCFYFSQVYGRFTHRHYDLILTQNVKNAPPEVIQFLRKNYSYIFAEPGMGAELTEERRGCVSCKQWTTGSDSVTCALCNGAYHFTCLNPPLIRKPERGHRWARGYQWACAPCSKKRHDSIEDQVASITKNLTDEPAASTSNGGGVAGSGRSLRDKGKKKEVTVTALVQPGNGPDGVLRTVDGWPFRYYGQYTEPTSVLDPMDSPHLYTAPRIGCRFQTNALAEVPLGFGTTISSQDTDKTTKVGKRSRDGTPMNASGFIPSKVDTPRGGDETIDVIYIPELSEKYQESDIDDYIRNARLLPVHRSVGVSLVDRALQTLQRCSSLEEAYSKLTEQAVKSFGFAHWTEGESHRMDNAIAQLGDDLRAMLKLFPKKNWTDVTKFFYMFKGHKFPEISALDSRIDASVSQSPDESSSVLPTPSSKRPYTCVVCEVRTAPVWRRCPEALMAGATLAKKCLCDECYLRWKKYGLQHVPVAEQEDNHRVVKERKPRGSYAKASKTSVSKHSLSAPSVPAPVAPATSTTPPTQPSSIDSQHPISLSKNPPSAPQQPPPLPERTLTPQHSPPPKELPSASQALPLPKPLPKPAPKPLPKALSKPLPKAPSKPSSKPLPKPLSSQSQRPPPSNSRVFRAVPVPCTLCKRVEPSARLASCKNCSLSCHTGCLGLDPNVNLESWKCLVCQNADSTAVSKVLCCSLCESKPRYCAPHEPFSALDVWKLSEYNSFVHMICAIWHSELTLGTSTDLSRVEGFASIPLSKRKRECIICHQSGSGVCTKCDQCSTFVHVSCAWSAGYKFGFEMLPQRKRRPREIDLVKYGEHHGLMEPRIWCSEHLPTSDRPTCDVADIDPLTQITALETFMQHQKDVASDPNLKILRKARRLDSVLDSVTKPKHASPASIWGRNLDLEDGYMVSALSMLPETYEALPQDSVSTVSTRQRRTSNQSPIDDSAPTGATGARVRNKQKVGNPSRNRSRGASRVIDKSDTPRNENECDDIPPSPDLMIISSPRPSRGKVSGPPPKPESSHAITPAPSGNSRPPKSKHLHNRLSEPNGLDVSNEGKRSGKSGLNVSNGSERGGKASTSVATTEDDRHPRTVTHRPIVKQPGGSFRSKSDATPSAVIPPSQHTVPPSSSGPDVTGSKGTPQEATPNTKPPSKLRLTIKSAHAPQPPTHLPAPSQIQPVVPERTHNQAPERTHNQAPERTHNRVLERNHNQVSERNHNQVLERNRNQVPERNRSQVPERHRNQVPERNHNQVPERNHNQVPERNHNHILLAPTFSYLPSPSMTLQQPPRPLSSSSSSSSLSSSMNPMITRLPPINHLDVFSHPIPRLHPLPAVATTPSMYLPPISSVTQPPRRPPLPTTLPPPPPLLPVRHQSPAPVHTHHAPAHFRFTAPLSTPPSFDAFARAAAATATKNNLQRVTNPASQNNSADHSAQSRPQANKNSPSAPSRHNILT